MSFFLFFFFKAHFLPLPIELERWFLHQKKGHGKPFLAYEIQFSISTINSIAGALKICDKCNFQKKFKAQFVPLFCCATKNIFIWLERACQDLSIDVRMASLAQLEVVKDGP